MILRIVFQFQTDSLQLLKAHTGNMFHFSEQYHYTRYEWLKPFIDQIKCYVCIKALMKCTLHNINNHDNVRLYLNVRVFGHVWVKCVNTYKWLGYYFTVLHWASIRGSLFCQNVNLKKISASFRIFWANVTHFSSRFDAHGFTNHDDLRDKKGDILLIF